MLPEVLKSVGLCKGKGEEGKTGCWMVAINLHTTGKWVDSHPSVDPCIASICRILNDHLSDENRTEKIMEFGFFEPLGTMGDADDNYRRYVHLLNWLKSKGVEVNFPAHDSAPAHFRIALDNRKITIEEGFELLRKLIDLGPKGPIERVPDGQDILQHLQV